MIAPESKRGPSAEAVKVSEPIAAVELDETPTRLYHYSFPNSISLKTLAGFGTNLQNRPKIVRYISTDRGEQR